MSNSLGFQNYTQISMNPGNSLLIATLIFGGLLLAALPCVVSVGKRFQQHETSIAETSSAAAKSKNSAEKLRGVRPVSRSGIPATGGGVVVASYRERHNDDSDDEDNNNNGDVDSLHSSRTGTNSVASTLVHAILSTSPHGGRVKRRHQVHLMHRETRIEQNQQARSFETLDFDDDDKSLASKSVLGRISHDEVSIRDAVDATEESVYTKGAVDQMHEDAPTGPWYSQCGVCFDRLLIVAEWDYETRRLYKLGLPFVLQAMLAGLMEVVRVALIGRLIGTPALSAYVTVTMIVGVTVAFLNGYQDACTTLCSQAVGTDNHKLAGQYIQIATILYAISYVPVFLLWKYFMGDTLTWLGFDGETRKIGEDFVTLYLFYSFLRGVSNSLHSMLDVIGKQTYSTSFVSAQEIVATLAILAAAIQPGASNLQLVGLFLIAEEGFALVVNSVIIVWKGWFDQYLDGLVGSLALMVSLLAGSDLALLSSC